MAKKPMDTSSSSSPITRSATAPRRSGRLANIAPTTTKQPAKPKKSKAPIAEEPAKPKRSKDPIAKEPAKKKKTKSTSEEKPSPAVKEAAEEKEEEAAEEKGDKGLGKEEDKGSEDKEDGTAEEKGDGGSGKEEEKGSEGKGDGAAEEKGNGGSAADDWSKTVVIEHCTQCNSFKTRALQVKEGLEKGVVGVKVVVNPEKPRRGCFVIRQEGGDVFINLLDMKRPFKNMKELVMNEVISDIVEKIK